MWGKAIASNENSFIHPSTRSFILSFINSFLEKIGMDVWETNSDCFITDLRVCLIFALRLI